METVNQTYDRRTFIDWCADPMAQFPVVGNVAKCVIRYLFRIICRVRSAAICHCTATEFHSALMSWNAAKQLLLMLYSRQAVHSHISGLSRSEPCCTHE